MARKRYRRKSARISKSVNTDSFVLLGVFLFVLAIYVYYVIIEALTQVKQYIASLSLIDWITFIAFFIFISIAFRLFIKYESKRKHLIHQEQRRLDEENLRKKVIREGERENLLAMHFNDFEHYIADLFRLKGYAATVTVATGDGGKDVILTKDDALLLVECKRYNMPNKVGRQEIQKFHSAIIDMKAKEGFFITTSYFTKTASEYVKEKPIHLIDLEQLLDMIYEVRNENGNMVSIMETLTT